MFGISPIQPAYGRDYKNKKSVEEYCKEIIGKEYNFLKLKINVYLICRIQNRKLTPLICNKCF